MRGEDDGVVRPLLEAEEEGGEIALMAGVEVDRGLVEHQQLRLLGQGGGDEDRLPLAAGELVDGAAAQLLDPHHPQGLFDGGEVRPPGRELQGREVGVAPEEHDLLDRERHRGGADLRHVGDVARDLAPRERGEGAAVEGDLAAGRREQPGEAAQESRLAGAVGPHDHQALAGEDVEVERPEDGPRPGAPGETAGAERGGWGQPAPRARVPARD